MSGHSQTSYNSQPLVGPPLAKRSGRMRARSASRGRSRSASRGPMSMFTPRRLPRSGSSFSRFPSDAGPELKFVDTTLGLGFGTSQGSAVPVVCNLVAQGLDYNQRIGRKMVMKHITLTGILTANIGQVGAAATNPAELCRIIVFIDKQPNGAAAIETDLLAPLPTYATSYSQHNLNNRDRFIVLRDIYRTVHAWSDPYTAGAAGRALYAAGGETSFTIREEINLGFPTIWSGTTGVVANVESGALLVMVIGSIAGVAGTSSNAFYGNCRLRYQDE